MHEGPGHHTGTFRLARALRARGHRVLYLGAPDAEELIARCGFEFVTFASDILPPGYRKTRAQQSFGKGILARLRQRISDETLFSKYLERIETGELDECLAACNPDVVLCDTFMWRIALRAIRLGLRTINVSCCISSHENALIPPSIYGIAPGTTFFSMLLVACSWKWMRLCFFFSKLVASRLFGAYRAPARMHHLLDEFRRMAKAAGYEVKENKSYWFGEYGPRLILPEIVLCSEAFQFEGGSRSESARMYLGDCIDDERQEDKLPVGSYLDEDKPLVLCSLGTDAGFYPHSRRFFEAVREASSLRHDWQFVLHVGDFGQWNEFGQLSENLLVCKRIPQLSLLRQSAAMVTHGGLNSMKECIHYEVPMVIVPGLRDQPGNAVRAVHHGLALKTTMADITGAKLSELIASAMYSKSIRQNLATMKKAIENENGLERVVRFIEEGNRQRTKSTANGGSLHE